MTAIPHDTFRNQARPQTDESDDIATVRGIALLALAGATVWTALVVAWLA